VVEQPAAPVPEPVAAAPAPVETVANVTEDVNTTSVAEVQANTTENTTTAPVEKAQPFCKYTGQFKACPGEEQKKQSVLQKPQGLSEQDAAKQIENAIDQK
jgi:hypothetical protein